MLRVIHNCVAGRNSVSVDHEVYIAPQSGAAQFLVQPFGTRCEAVVGAFFNVVKT